MGGFCPHIQKCAGGGFCPGGFCPTLASGCKASENFDISNENFFPMYANIFCDAGQVPILRYFEACFLVQKCMTQETPVPFLLLFFLVLISFGIKDMVPKSRVTTPRKSN